MAALRRDGWLQPGQPLSASRFGRLLDDERGPMAGGFSPYEQQLLADWLEAPDTPRPRRALAAVTETEQEPAMTAINRMAPEDLLPWLAPSRHFTPGGLAATRRFRACWAG